MINNKQPDQTDLLTQYKEFLKHLDEIVIEAFNNDTLCSLYDECVYVEFMHQTLKIPFDAVVSNGLHDLINLLIEEY